MEQDYFEEIADYVLENQKKFYRMVYSSVRNEQDAMDIVQNAICKALEHSRDLRNIQALKTWFYRILMNESMGFLKKNRREILLEEPMEIGTCNDETESKDVQGLYREIGRLPQEVQIIIRLRFYEELSLQEIAEVTGLNLNTVKAKLYRALKTLRVEMEGVAI